MVKYAIVIEEAGAGYSAYAPDVPGCIATGKTSEEVADRMKSALEAHFELMAEDGEKIPKSIETSGTMVDVEVPTQ